MKGDGEGGVGEKDIQSISLVPTFKSLGPAPYSLEIDSDEIPLTAFPKTTTTSLASINPHAKGLGR